MDIFRQHFKVNTYLIKLLEKVFRKQINMQLGNVFMCGSNRGVWGSLEGCMRCLGVCRGMYEVTFSHYPSYVFIYYSTWENILYLTIRLRARNFYEVS